MKVNIRKQLSVKKKKKYLPVLSTCRNCDTQLISRYCHNCGQDIFAGRERTVREIMYNTVETIFAFDNKILRTMKYLMFYPGKLTKEFFDGKVIRYVYPAKLFWFLTLLFFATLTFVTNDDLKLVGSRDTAVVTTTNVDKTVEQQTKKGQQVRVNDENPDNENKAILNNLMSYSPYVILLLVPIFAFMLLVFFYKNKDYYSHHIIFSLHAHSFIFFFFTILILIEAIIPSIEVSALVYMLVPCIYFIVALYIVYRPKKRNMIWKIPIIMLLYAIVILVTLLVMVIVAVALTDSELFAEILEDLFE